MDISEALKNSSSLNPAHKAYTPPPQLVALAQHVMDGVKTGKISSLGVVTVSPLGEINVPACGMQALEIYAGADLLKDEIKAAMRGQGQAGKIIRAG